MAVRHGIGSWVSDEDLAAIEASPPAWLLQSRSNRTGRKPVWVELTCAVCGFTESTRPKKWWPPFTFITCDYHGIDELPDAAPGHYRREFDGVGSRFVGVYDESPVQADAAAVDAEEISEGPGTAGAESRSPVEGELDGPAGLS